MQNQLRAFQTALRQETLDPHLLAGLQTTAPVCRFAQYQCRNLALHLTLHSCFLLHRDVAQFKSQSR
jgi:hypothetical protein